MIDQNALARNWVGWFGVELAAEELQLSVEQIREMVSTPKRSTRSRKLEQEGVEKKTRPTYTPEQKAEALKLLAEVGLTKASQQTGISMASLMKWRAQA